MRCTVLFSGGFDSTACLSWALHRWGRRYVAPVFARYGQRHAEQEFRAAQRIAAAIGVRLRVMSLRMTGPSALTGAGDLDSNSVVVPGRNGSLIRLVASSHWRPTDIVIGACLADAVVFDDCRPDFIASMSAELAPVRVHAPLLGLSKRETLRFAAVHGGLSLLASSWSCYAGLDRPCGDCMACRHRIEPCLCVQPATVTSAGDDVDCSTCGGAVR